MAVSLLCGFEMGTTAEGYAVSTSAGSTNTIQSTTKRTGTFAFRSQPSASSGATAAMIFGVRQATGTTPTPFQSVRFYLNVASLPADPGAFAVLFTLSSTNSVPSVGTGSLQALILNDDGTLTVRVATTAFTGANTNRSTNALTVDGQWHRIDFDVGWNAGAGARVFVDGVQWASTSTGAATQAAFALVGSAAMASSGVNHNCDLYFDDVTFYDSALPGTLTDYSLNLLKPVSHNSLGNWKRNDGVTTLTMYDAVDNTPPTGTAVTAVLGANYVQNGTAGSSAPADNLDLDCANYNSITGLTASSQVKAVMPICNDAQQITTGSPKSGAVSISSNPVVADQSFDFGLPNGLGGSTTAAAQGAFPAGWGTHTGAVVENPTVTITAPPIVRVKRTGTYTRVISVDFMGVYVLWEAAPIATKSPPFDGRARYRRNPNYRR